MKKLILALFFTGLLINFSCKKDANNVKSVLATVIDGGNIAADGCGWLIKTDATSTTYKPGTLPASFQKDQLKVVISYRLLTTKYKCGPIFFTINTPNNGDNGIPEITINTIAVR